MRKEVIAALVYMHLGKVASVLEIPENHTPFGASSAVGRQMIFFAPGARGLA